ncbi:MAG: ATP-binding protein [Deltaproteobacteria bacterium]|nr:ATP-binding protein [Deltaproteobacteria bacterium]
MAYFTRILDLRQETRTKSLFLFGPRQTGKTSLLRALFPESPLYNLLLADVFLRISQRPQIIREELTAYRHTLRQPIVIDEIQKLPILLDEVQYMIDEYGWRFILTGSSARKLKRGAANLLGGRLRMRHLFPLVSAEIPHYDLLRFLNYGALPPIYTATEPEEDLAAYIGTYLQEEIQAEGAVRKIENFSRFLQVAALTNGTLLNFSSIASDAGVPARTVVEYYSLLQDTLVGALLEPYTRTKRRKAIATAKFYFFDIGVSHHLAGRQHIRPRTELFGNALEHFLFTELRAYLAYRRDRRPLHFWRSASGYEVDFLVGDDVAIEVKGTANIVERHLTGLQALTEEIRMKKKIVVAMVPLPRVIQGIHILPVATFLEQLWSDQY